MRRKIALGSIALLALLSASCAIASREVATPTPSPTPGNSAGVPTATPVTTPVATAEFAFLVIRSEQMPGTNPRAIHFTVEVIGGPDNNPAIYCKDIVWTFGDGQVVTESMECIPWTQETKIDRTLEFDHVFDHPGKYDVTVRIPDAQLQASTAIDLSRA
jgi:hypothetical protein